MDTNETQVMEIKLRKLKRFNLSMGFLHLVQGLLMILLSNDTTYPIFTSFLKFNTETFSLVPDPKLIYDLRFGPAVAVFLLISAVAHFYLATIGYNKYVANLKKGMNPIRFIEYALSSSLMIVLIGMLSGLWDLGIIILIFGLNAMMNLFGIIAGIIPWIVIFLFFFGSVSGDAKPPTFVYVINPTLFVFFNIFAINMVLQYKKVGPWKDYLFGERAYIILSLVSKSILASLIFAGTLAP